MRKILFVINPAAGNGGSKSIIPMIKENCEANHIQYSIRISTMPNQITNLVESELVKEDYSDVVAVGGDGTAVEVINAILDQDIAFGLISTGTGNDFSRSLNHSTDPVLQMEKIIAGETALVDIGEVNGYAFINSVGVGIDGDIIESTQNIKKVISGSAAYLLSTVKTILKFKSFESEIIIDGVRMKKDIMLIAVGNGQYFGGGMKITPGADLTSGEFEVCLVRRLAKSRFLRLFSSVYKGTHVGIPEVEMYKCRSIEIIPEDRKLRVSADGNLVSETPARIDMKQKKLRVHV